jgi:prophage maintenance system killer protein
MHVEAAIQKKIAKRYGSGVWLVIYLNLNDYGIRQQQTELVIAQVKQQHANAFDALFVLWKDKVY